MTINTVSTNIQHTRAVSFHKEYDPYILQHETEDELSDEKLSLYYREWRTEEDAPDSSEEFEYFLDWLESEKGFKSLISCDAVFNFDLEENALIAELAENSNVRPLMPTSTDAPEVQPITFSKTPDQEEMLDVQQADIIISDEDEETEDRENYHSSNWTSVTGSDTAKNTLIYLVGKINNNEIDDINNWFRVVNHTTQEVETE